MFFRWTAKKVSAVFSTLAIASNIIPVKVLLCSFVVCLSYWYEIQETDNALLDFYMEIEECPVTANVYAVDEIITLHLMQVSFLRSSS